MNKYEKRFYELNKIREPPLCCKGKCFNNYISIVDTSICGKCEKEKHVDHFLESKTGYLCDFCDNLKNTIDSMSAEEFKQDSKKFVKGIDTMLKSFN